MWLSTRLLLHQGNAAKREAARARRRSLERDLACFETAAEQRDLLATFDRYPNPATRELRLVLDRTTRRRELSRQVRQWPAMRPGNARRA